MTLVLALAQIASAVILTSLVLLQAKGVGLGRTFGSASYHSKRGMERLTFRATIVTAVAFCLFSALKVLL